MADDNKEFLQNPTEKIIKVNEICRFCLSDTKNNVTINDKCPSEELNESGDDSIYNFVTKLNFIKMENKSNFPLQVCESCYGSIKICNEFRQLCQKSDAVLGNYYKRINNTQDGSSDIKIMIEIPNTQGDLIEGLPAKRLKDTPDEGDKLGVLDALSAGIKKARLKLTKENACHECSLIFGSARDLQYHNVVTHNQKRFKGLFKFHCKYCQKLFGDESKLIRHCKVVHKISPSELTDDFLNNRKGLVGVEPLKQQVGEDVSEGVLVCTKPDGGCVSQPLTAFINVLDSVVESLTISQLDNQSGFRLVCKNCNPSLEFVSMGEFIKHINAHHGGLKLVGSLVANGKANGGWRCPECPVTYTRKQSLYCHMRDKHKRSVFEGMICPEPGCSECFSINRQLIQHGIVVHQKYFAYFHKVFKNVLQPTDESDKRVKNFECDICQKKYLYKTSLRKHICGSHLNQPVKHPVVCSYCGKTVSDKLNLKSHIEFVHEALFVSCPICRKKINFRTIGKHYKTHKTNSEVCSPNSFLCNLCGRILKSKRSFEDHQKLHKNIRDEVCDICGSGFTTKKFLRLHKKTHEGVRKKIFNCDQCEKAFSGRQTLNRHILTHSGEKNFICEICSKCFYTLQELNRHVRYHKKEYRFDCQLCDMRFLDKSRFRHHMMRHRNVRPHKCQFCDKMFIVRGKMNLHIAAKHNVEVENRKGVWKDPKTYVPLDDLL